uniref:Uncharacterized protein n=1 Tax=Mycena chlorophos TaxID=658473 RepID=A0ABQ0L7N7_MYCCL|nr:predicted protein [Mycena chlorophos]
MSSPNPNADIPALNFPKLKKKYPEAMFTPSPLRLASRAPLGGTSNAEASSDEESQSPTVHKAPLPRLIMQNNPFAPPEKVSQMTDAVYETRRKYDYLKGDYRTLEIKHEKVIDENELLRLRVEQLEKAMENEQDLHAEYDQLKITSDGHKKKIDQLKVTISEVVRSRESALRRTTALEGDFASLNRDYGDAMVRLADAQGALNRMKGQLGDLETKFKTLADGVDEAIAMVKMEAKPEIVDLTMSSDISFEEIEAEK